MKRFAITLVALFALAAPALANPPARLFVVQQPVAVVQTVAVPVQTQTLFAQSVGCNNGAVGIQGYGNGFGAINGYNNFGLNAGGCGAQTFGTNFSTFNSGFNTVGFNTFGATPFFGGVGVNVGIGNGFFGRGVGVAVGRGVAVNRTFIGRRGVNVRVRR